MTTAAMIARIDNGTNMDKQQQRQLTTTWCQNLESVKERYPKSGRIERRDKRPLNQRLGQANTLQ